MLLGAVETPAVTVSYHMVCIRGSVMGRVLVVEDNEFNKVLVKDVLTMNGHEVLEASESEEALKLIRSEAPGLVLMDLGLPGKSGVEVLAMIREDEGIKDIPVVALTAAAMHGDEKSLIEKGFNAYLSKPIDMQQLLATVTKFAGS